MIKRYVQKFGKTAFWAGKIGFGNDNGCQIAHSILGSPSALAD